MGVGLGGFLKAVFIGFAAGTTPSAALVLGVNLARIGVMVLVAKITAPRLDLSDIAHKKLVTIRDTVAPQKFIYGEDMVSGPVIFAGLSGALTGNNDNLYQLVALAGHEVDDVLVYRIDDEDVLLSDLSGPKDGTVDTGKYAGVAEVDVALGTSTQPALTLLTTPFASTWTSAHTARGWAIMAWKFSLVDGLEAAYDSGVPRNLKALLRGYRLYDPRLDGSIPGGTGLHRVADPTTWEWADNPALCLAHFIIDTKFGMKEDTTRVDWSMVQTAADICDETVVIPTASTQARYTCNATFLATEARRDVRDTLLGAMMGRMVFSQGLWKMWAGAAITPDVTITEANLAGGIQLQASTGAKERYNIVRGKFVDADRGYLANPYITQKSSVYIADDGGEERETVADMLHTNNEYEAQRKAIIFLKQSRNQRIVAFQGNFSCFRIQPGATVLLDIAEYGFAGEKFYVTEWSFSEDGIQLTLVEEDDTAWTDPIEGDYSTRTSTGTITSVGTGVPAPTSLTATTLSGGVALDWTNPTAQLIDHIEVWASETNVRSNAILIGTTAADSYLDVQSDIQRARYYWIRAVDAVGRISTWEPDLTTTTAVAFPLIGQRPVVADPFIRLGASYWDLTSSNATYNVGGGLDGTDSITLATDVSFGASMITEARRGPKEWDVMVSGKFAVEVRYRAALTDNAGGADFGSLAPIIRLEVTDEAEATTVRYTSQDIPIIFTNASTVGVWEDASVIVEVDEIGSVPPRFIQVEVLVVSNGFGPECDIEFLEATILGPIFDGAGKSGIVSAQSASIGSVLKDDASWGNNPGGQTDASYAFSTTITSGDPGAGNIRFNNATLASVTALYISATDNDGLDSDTFLGFLATENRLYFEVSGQPTKSALFSISGALTDNAGWWTIPVTVVGSATLPSNLNVLSLVADFNVSGAGGGGDVTASGTPLNNEVAVFTGLTDINSDATFTWDGTTLEATQFAGIAKANLLDKSQPETITLPTNQDWTFTGDGTNAIRLDLGTDIEMESNDGLTYVSMNHNNSDFRFVVFGTGANTESFYMNGFLDLKLDFPIHIKEQVAADSFKLGYGQIWVKTVTPNELWFTDDAGTDVQLGVGGNVSNTATPLNNQLAIWTNATTIEGVADLTYDGTDFDINAIVRITSDLYVGGDVTGHFESVSGVEGSVQVDGKDGSTGFFAGYAISTRSVFFDTGGTLTTNEIGVYDQLNTQYVLRYNADQTSHHTSLYDDGTLKLQTLATGILVVGDVGATTFNGVPLTDAGVATNFLNETGAYSVPADHSVTAKILADVTTPSPPTTTLVNARLRIRDSDDSDTLAEFGFTNANDLKIENFMHGGLLTLSMQDSAGNARTLISGDPDGNTQINGDTEVQIGQASSYRVFVDGVDVRTLDPLKILESANAVADEATYGQHWVKNNAPNDAYFTTDNGLDYPLGYGTYRLSAANTLDNKDNTETIGAQHISGIWHKTTTTARTLTLEASTGFNFRVGAQLAIYNRSTSGDMTITDTASQALWLLDGATAVDTAGGVTIGPGGYATLIRESATVSTIMGAGITNP